MRIISCKPSEKKPMINFNRVFAMLLRYLFNLRHSYDRLTDMFYWPAMDLAIWGLMGLYFVKQVNNSHAINIVLTGLIFWIVTWRAQYEININLLAELWDRNIVNIFVSPLTLKEWLFSFLLMGFGKMLISLAFSAILAFLLYHFKIFSYGLWIIPFVLNLLLTGWAIGFFISGFLIYFGEKIQTIAWSGIYLIAPFSALYYSLSILPPWAQKIAMFVPTSYIFEGMREILFTGSLSYDKLFISFALNIIYLVLSIWFFVFMFNKSKNIGLGRLI